MIAVLEFFDFEFEWEMFLTRAGGKGMFFLLLDIMSIIVWLPIFGRILHI